MISLQILASGRQAVDYVWKCDWGRAQVREMLGAKFESYCTREKRTG